mmetsp:Transcript_47978/g.104397  ORF Transcript_47978/g.104397 Transcript_47978/m.104397 type:complete len:393 (-) Transcript_47978:91-1269(-)
MGGGASKKLWQCRFHLTSNVLNDGAETYQEIYPVWSIAITKNQRQLAAATSDNRINLWCLVRHTKLIAMKGHNNTIWCIAYSPNDELLASASADDTVWLWKVNSGRPVMIFPRCYSNWVTSLAWSPDGSRLATGGTDAKIMLWDAQEAAEAAVSEEATRRGAHEETAWEWSAAAAAAAEKAAEAAKPVAYWQAHEKTVTGLCFAGDTQMLVSASADGTLAVWTTATGELDVRLMGHLGAVTCVSVHPRLEELVATGGEDHTVRLWDLRDIQPGTVIAGISRDKPLGYNLAHFTLKGHEAGVVKVRFCGDGRLLASASKDCEVRIWNPDVRNGPTLNARFVAHEAWVQDIAWTADQHFLFTASTDGLIFAWQVPSKYYRKAAALAPAAAKYKK